MTNSLTKNKSSRPTSVFKTNRILIFAILFSAPLSSIGIDLYTPSLPFIMHVFHTNQLLPKLTLTGYLFGLGVGFLFFGCLCEHFGRRPLLQACLIFNILTNIAILLCNSIHLFIVLRFLQGFIVAGIAVIPRAILLDLFKGNEFKRVISMYVSIWSLGPVIAPFIGGYIQQYLGWKYSFVALAGYGFITFILFQCNNLETLAKERRLHLRNQHQHIYHMIKQPMFLLGIFALLCGYSFIITFNVMAPFIIQNLFHHTPVYYGYVALLFGLFYTIGTINNTRLLHTLNSHIITFWGLLFMLLMVIILISISFLIKTHNTYLFLAPICFMLTGLGFVYPNIYGDLLSHFTQAGGIANALIGMGISLGVFLTSTLASIPLIASTRPLAISFGLLFFLLIVSYTFYNRYIKTHQKQNID